MVSKKTPKARAEVLELHGDLYPLACIESAMRAFRDVATLTLERGEPRHRVRIAGVRGAAAAKVRAELANYVLALVAEAPVQGGSGTSASS